MERFWLSFAFGGLLGHETRVIAEEYLKDRDPKAAKSRISKQCPLQNTRPFSSQRYFEGIRNHLCYAHDWEVDLLTIRSRKQSLLYLPLLYGTISF